MSTRARKLIVYADTRQEPWHHLLSIFWNVLDAQHDFEDMPDHLRLASTQQRLSRVWNKIQIFKHADLMASKVLLLDLDMLVVSSEFDQIWSYMSDTDTTKVFGAVHRGVNDWEDNAVRPKDTLFKHGRWRGGINGGLLFVHVQPWVHDYLLQVLRKWQPHSTAGGEQDFWTEAFAGQTYSINKTFNFQLHQLQLAHTDGRSDCLALAPILDHRNMSRQPRILHFSACPKPSNLLVDEDHDAHWEAEDRKHQDNFGVDWETMAPTYMKSVILQNQERGCKHKTKCRHCHYHVDQPRHLEESCRDNQSNKPSQQDLLALCADYENLQVGRYVEFFCSITWPTIVWSILKAVITQGLNGKCPGNCGATAGSWENGPHILCNCPVLSQHFALLELHVPAHGRHGWATKLHIASAGKKMRFILKWMGLVMETWQKKLRIDIKLTQVICLDALHRWYRGRQRNKGPHRQTPLDLSRPWQNWSQGSPAEEIYIYIYWQHCLQVRGRSRQTH